MEEKRSAQTGRTGGRGGVVRLTDVAALAGVSSSLASRVLNADPRVRATPDTKTRVLDAAERLGYVPNVAARSLRARRTGLLGLVVHDLSSPIYLELLQGAKSAAAARSYFLVLGDVDELLGDDEAFRILVNGKRVDGLVVQGGHGEFDQRIAEIAQALPTVVVNAPPDMLDRIAPLVYPDETAASRLLTEHLIGLGHRRIGLVSGPEDSPTNRLRERGVREALAAVGLVLRDEDVAHRSWTAEGGGSGLRELATGWSDAGDRPTALVAGNALIGVGLLGAADAVGLRVPVDISIAAVHDSWMSNHLVPALTTVGLPLREMGEEAVRLLLDRPSEPAEIVIADPPPVLHVRASTAPIG